jgi:hypothetical protein
VGVGKVAEALPTAQLPYLRAAEETRGGEGEGRREGGKEGGKEGRREGGREKGRERGRFMPPPVPVLISSIDTRDLFSRHLGPPLSPSPPKRPPCFPPGTLTAPSVSPVASISPSLENARAKTAASCIINSSRAW